MVLLFLLEEEDRENAQKYFQAPKKVLISSLMQRDLKVDGEECSQAP